MDYLSLKDLSRKLQTNYIISYFLSIFNIYIVIFEMTRNLKLKKAKERRMVTNCQAEERRMARGCQDLQVRLMCLRKLQSHRTAAATWTGGRSGSNRIMLRFENI